MQYEDLGSFIRCINDNGTVSDIPKDIGNIDYRNYIKTIPLEGRIVTPTKAELDDINLKVILAEVFENIGVAEAYATLVILKKRRLKTVPKKWRDDVREIIAKLATQDEVQEQED